ncbi:MAG: hypothetical protein LBU39_02950 [Desulfobulbaceae bacterium]|jgi:putative ABC transport system permease protein|nr:hypothetical protein [Desulfobulbaceae bacterium]
MNRRISFILRELRASGRQALVLFCCVVLAVASLALVNSFQTDVAKLLRGDARALHGGDLLIDSHYPFSAALERAVTALTTAKGARLCRLWHLNSLIRKDDRSVLCQLKVVEADYPLYGEVRLQSGRTLAAALRPGSVIVAPELLSRLNLRLGDRVRLGEADLEIADVLLGESSRPVELFRMGPPVIAAAADLAAMNLVREGSRVQYEIAVALPPGLDPEHEAEVLRTVVAGGSERVETAATARSGVKRFFDNLLFFLSLAALATLLLSGIGVHSSTTALLRERQISIAICKALGADLAFLFGHYLGLIALVAVAGCLTATLMAALAKPGFGLLFPGVLPTEHLGSLGSVAAASAAAFGFAAALLFALGPLASIAEIKPMLLLRRQTPDGAALQRTLGKALVMAPVALLVAILVIGRMEDTRTGLYFLCGMTALSAVAFAFADLFLRLAARLSPRSLTLRLALRGLSRPGNASRSVMTTLATALALLFTMFLLRHNLEGNYIASFPPDAPNVFVLNIQKDECERFQKLITIPCRLYPVIRGRLKAINGKAVVARNDGKPAMDTLAREFNLTYNDSLLPDEHIIAGKALFKHNASGQTPLQVSILDTVRDLGDMKIGDILTFSIHGLPLTAPVTSIRARDHSGPSPFFYFVLPPQYLRDAPWNAFAAIKLPPAQVAALQNLLASEMPHLSVLNLGELAAEMGRVTAKFVRLVNFFAALSIVAGILILWGSLLATRLSRLAEAVYYRVMGASKWFILRIFLVENLILGLASALVAVLIAQPAAWLVCRHGLNLSYQPFWSASLTLIALTALLVGLAVLPGRFGARLNIANSLKEQSEE